MEKIILKAILLFVLIIAVLVILNVTLTEIGYESILWKDFMLKILANNSQIIIFVAWILVFLIIWAFPKLFE